MAEGSANLLPSAANAANVQSGSRPEPLIHLRHHSPAAQAEGHPGMPGPGVAIVDVSGIPIAFNVIDVAEGSLVVHETVLQHRKEWSGG